MSRGEIIINNIKNSKTSLIIERVIEYVNNSFISIGKSKDTEKNQLLTFFREKYIQSLLYFELEKEGFNVEFEEATKWKFMITGKKPRSGKHDLVIFNNNKQIAAIEIFLGFDIGYKNLNYKKFETHINIDYKKLIKSKINNIYILNYFYKGESIRKSPNRTARKENSYQNHYQNCIVKCENIFKDHQLYNPNINLGLWLIHAREDKINDNNIKKVN